MGCTEPGHSTCWAISDYATAPFGTYNTTWLARSGPGKKLQALPCGAAASTGELKPGVDQIVFGCYTHWRVPGPSAGHVRQDHTNRWQAQDAGRVHFPARLYLSCAGKHKNQDWGQAKLDKTLTPVTIPKGQVWGWGQLS